MKRFIKISLGISILLFAFSCHYHYGPEENLNGENTDGKIRQKAYVKSNDPKSRSIQDIEADIAILKANMDLVTDNLDKSDKGHTEQLNILKAQVQQLKLDYDQQLTRMYWIMSGTVLLLIAAGFIGVHTYVE